MKIERIEIKIDDNRRFADVAFLVDQTDFLKFIQELRPILGLPVAPDEFSKWLKRYQFVEINDHVFKRFTDWFCRVTRNKDEKSLDLILWSREHINKTKKPYSVVNALYDSAVRLCDYFNKSSNYNKAIVSAISTNLVTDKDYETSFLSLYSPNLNAQTAKKLPDSEPVLFNMPDEPAFALYFQYDTNPTTLMKIIKEQLPKLKQAYEHYIQLWNLKYYPEGHAKSAINDHRDWYWRYLEYNPIHKKGNIWVELAKREAKRTGNLDPDNPKHEHYIYGNSEIMRKAIGKYIELLQRPL